VSYLIHVISCFQVSTFLALVLSAMSFDDVQGIQEWR